MEDCIEVWPLRGGFPLLEDSLDVKKKGRYKK